MELQAVGSSPPTPVHTRLSRDSAKQGAARGHFCLHPSVSKDAAISATWEGSDCSRAFGRRRWQRFLTTETPASSRLPLHKQETRLPVPLGWSLDSHKLFFPARTHQRRKQGGQGNRVPVPTLNPWGRRPHSPELRLPPRDSLPLQGRTCSEAGRRASSRRSLERSP